MNLSAQKKQQEKRYRMPMVHVVLWCAILVVLGVIFNRIFFPFGTWRVIFRPEKPNHTVIGFASKEKYRILGTTNGTGASDSFQLITVDPVYFGVKMPRRFSAVQIKLFYQNENNQEEINVGFQSPKGKSYKIHGLAYYHELIESLRDTWQFTSDGDLLLIQKRKPEWERQRILGEYAAKKREVEEQGGAFLEERLDQLIADQEQDLRGIRADDTIHTYETVQSFFTDPPPAEEIASYRFPYEIPQMVRGYRANSAVRTIEVPIRGPHVFYTYIKDEDLYFQFDISDINRHEGRDPFTVTITRNGQEVWKKTLNDDGNDKANGVASEARSMEVRLPSLTEGVYRMSIETNDDIFITKFSTTQNLLVVKDHIYLAGNAEYKDIINVNDMGSTDLVFRGDMVTASTSHLKSLQTITVHGNSVPIKALKKGFSGTAEPRDWIHVFSPENDIYLNGNGYFAFEREMAFVPCEHDILPLSYQTDLNTINYIIARYPQPSKEGIWSVAEYEEKNPPINEEQRINMIINVPHLSEGHKTIKIHKIEMTFTKTPWTLNFLRQKIISWFNKI